MQERTALKQRKVPFYTIPNDPLNVQQYTLPNGLKLFLSVNKNEPRVFTNIVVRAGSKHDPADTTGLAHYMEHMLFKGTSKIGALDWEKESAYLEKIAELYEKHRFSDSEEERKEIYQEIDRLSFEAAKLVAPNEYDTLVSSLGAKDTNAYTWVEQTVYVNDIPANELERWMYLESERFRMMALRLFHTELETVYEEFNIGQDQDFRKVNKAIREALFPSHPYGTQTTIGAAQHLKNPSHYKIRDYFRTYYVPNNMGIVLSGDFDPQEAVRLAERYFGEYEARPVPPFSYERQPRLKEPVHVDVYGQQAAFADLAWRFEGAHTDNAMMAMLIRQMLYNQQAGLLDINLNQRQQVLTSQAWMWAYEDYSVLGLYAKPREGQSLEEARELLLGEIQRLKEGAFDDWLIEAAVKDLKLTDVKASEENRSRVSMIAQAFILGVGWERMVSRFDWWEKCTKEQVVDFARRYLDDSYVSIFKNQQEDEGVVKVKKPNITPVQLQRDAVSGYAHTFLGMPSKQLKPKFADFAGLIQQEALQDGLLMEYVQNPDNELFRLDYIFEMGKLHDRWLPIALRYLPYLGTSRYSAAELQRAFFRLGISFDLHVQDRRLYLTISGLEESMPEGLRLMEHLLDDIQPDAAPLTRIIDDVLTRRSHAKNDRSHILRRALASYAKYGPHSPYSYRLTTAELKAAEPEQLVRKLKELTQYEHNIHYYGQRPQAEVIELLKRHHQRPEKLRAISEPPHFTQLPTKENEVLLVDFPMVQSDVMLVSRGTPEFSLEEFLMSELFNEYFGYGLSSIVFQEIRESKALAYSTFAYYSSPNYKNQAHYLQAYLGTQPDKLSDAIPALRDIIQEMPMAKGQLEHARQSILRRIESEYISPSRLYWEARAARQLGFDRDLNEDLYKFIEAANADLLLDFHREYVKGRHFKYLLLGREKDMDTSFLDTVGQVQRLSLEEVFGY